MQRAAPAAGALTAGDHADRPVETVEAVDGGAGKGEVGEDVLYHFYYFFR